MKKAPREQYPTDTVDLVGPESVEWILPPNQIRNTFDVQVDHHDGEQRDEEQGVGGYKIGEV